MKIKNRKRYNDLCARMFRDCAMSEAQVQQAVLQHLSLEPSEFINFHKNQGGAESKHVVMMRSRQLINNHLVRESSATVLTKAETLSYLKKILVRTSAASVQIELSGKEGKISPQ